MNQEKMEERAEILSPLKLIYTAYTDERPTYNQVMEEGFQNLDHLLTPLPEQDRGTVMKTFCTIYGENERLSFLAGLRTGFHLAQELRED